MLIQKTISPSLLDLSYGEASPDRNENPCLGDLPFGGSGGKERPIVPIAIGILCRRLLRQIAKQD